jgi:hypothetical protein
VLEELDLDRTMDAVAEFAAAWVVFERFMGRPWSYGPMMSEWGRTTGRTG